jgi:hypothetical protein
MLEAVTKARAPVVPKEHSTLQSMLTGTCLTGKFAAIPAGYFVAVIDGFLVESAAAGTAHILACGGPPAAMNLRRRRPLPPAVAGTSTTP